MAVTYTEMHIAKKSHHCAGNCSEKQIEPGERYVDEVVPPWVLVKDDPDTAPLPMGNWVHVKYHMKCYNDRYYTY